MSALYHSVASCEGADDNATGVAGALGVARALASGSWSKDLVIACWHEEERGLVGSAAWARRAATAGGTIEVAVALEMLGYVDSEPGSRELPSGFDVAFPKTVAAVEAREYRGDFIAVVGDQGADFFSASLVEQAPGSLPTVRVDVPTDLLASPAIRDLRRSDRASFRDQGVPALMITDTANFRYPGYHCGDGSDTVSRLDEAFGVDVTRMVASATAATSAPAAD